MGAAIVVTSERLYRKGPIATFAMFSSTALTLVAHTCQQLMMSVTASADAPYQIKPQHRLVHGQDCSEGMQVHHYHRPGKEAGRTTVLGEQLETRGIEDDKADIKKLIKAALSQEGASDWLLITLKTKTSSLAIRLPETPYACLGDSFTIVMLAFASHWTLALTTISRSCTSTAVGERFG